MITLGIDIGSTTSKCILLRDGKEIIGKSLLVGGMGTDSPKKAMDTVLKECEITPEDVARTIVTGYGRKNFEFGDGSVIDIGGQDAKVIVLSESGRMSNFVMNDKCAAGTGRFLDVMATILQMDIGDFDACAAKSSDPASISSTCTVFAESEVISQLANGVKREDLIAGICSSVAARVSALARRAGVTPMVCMSGGVAKNGAVRRALSESLDMEIAVDPLAQYFGAIGAALYAYRQAIK